MLRFPLACVLLLATGQPNAANPAPPTPSRQTTCFTEPLVDAWVDHTAALEATFADWMALAFRVA